MSDIKGLLVKYSKIKDERFFKELYEHEEYKPARAVKADVVLDIGACAGEFAAYIYDKAKVIYSIEPESNHYAELVENVKEFEMDKVKTFNLALGGENEERGMRLGGRGSHQLVGKDQGQKVNALTLATFMKENNIETVDILKIDVEDAEGEIFGAKDFKDVVGKINYIIGEHLSSLKTLLTGYGFSEEKWKNNFIFKR